MDRTPLLAGDLVKVYLVNDVYHNVLLIYRYVCQLMFFMGLYSQIFQTHCKQVVDKYIEYDLVVVSLDAVLLKRQAFRHIIINSGIQVSKNLQLKAECLEETPKLFICN